jgi:hypothetical protein
LARRLDACVALEVMMLMMNDDVTTGKVQYLIKYTDVSLNHYRRAFES